MGTMLPWWAVTDEQAPPVYQRPDVGHGCMCAVCLTVRSPGLRGLKREAIANPTPSH